MDIKKQLEIINRGTAEIISEKELIEKLKKSQETNQPLKVKAGFDPSAPDIHLGHAVLLRKLRDFQDAGHIVYFLIGDFTGRIGDPTGQSATRKQLTKQEVMENAKTYQRQVFKILDKEKTKIVFNSQWFDKMSFLDVLKLTSHSTVAQMLARADFKERFEKGIDISLVEFMYPLLQAYDSVVLEADVEVGGIDQKFNLLKGRQLQGDYGLKQQIVVMMPLLVGTDGQNKMSKSLGNYIGIEESARDIFGKLMSINDEIMFLYYQLLTDMPQEQIEGFKSAVKDNSAHPKELKLNLASLIVEYYYGKEIAKNEKEEFDSVFKNKNLPKELPLLEVSQDKLKDGKICIVQLIIDAGFEASKTKIKKLIQQGAVTIDGRKVDDINLQIKIDASGVILKIGKKGFVKVVALC